MRAALWRARPCVVAVHVPLSTSLSAPSSASTPSTRHGVHPTPSTRVKAPRTRLPRLDPEDVVVEGRVGAELRLLEAEGLAPGRLLRLVLWCWLCLVRRWRVSLSPRRCACQVAVGSEVGSAAGSEVGSAAGAAPKTSSGATRRGLARAGAGARRTGPEHTPSLRREENT